jgi:hypothetical protein
MVRLQPLRAALARLVPDTVAVRRKYRKRNGCWPDLRGPRDFTEKLCWLKLNYVTDLQRQCADKIAVRDYVTDVVGPHILVSELARLECTDDLVPEAFGAAKFVAKTTHDSGGVVICRDRDGFDWAAARAKLSWHLGRDYYWHARERVYKGMKRRILVEEYLAPADESPLRDTKFWCIHGKVVLIEALAVTFTGMSQGASRQVFFDRDWQPVDVQRVHPAPDVLPSSPVQLAQMIEIAEALSTPFPFARIDLFDVDKSVYFGEITFYPSGAHIRFRPDAAERQFGDMLKLPTASR